MFKIKLGAALLLAGAAESLAASTGLDIVAESPDHSTMVSAVTLVSGLVGTLTSPGPFTIFAPTDEVSYCYCYCGYLPVL